MPKKILAPDEFDSLHLPLVLTPKISEGCRHVFVDHNSVQEAATLCGMDHQKEIEDLYAAIEIINKYIPM
ncbi:MAG TPA: hypothetical protein VK949_08185 [Methylotenera sp.]|jgi:hypothetical protein|nr:hypothetical protein [Methylotenera sp.]